MTRILLFASFVALVFLSYTASAADSPFWNAYKQQLFSFLKGGQSSQGLQLLKEPLVAKYDIAPSEQSLADILNPVSQYGDVRVITNKDFIPIQYYEFLSNLKVKPMSPETEQRIEEQKGNVKAILNVIEEEDPKCQNRYNQYREYGIAQGTYEQFIQQWCSRLSSTLSELALAEMELRRLTSSAADQDVRDALANFDKALSKDSFEWKETFTTSLSYFRQKIAKNQLNTFQISISKSQLKNQEAQTEWSATEGDSFIKNSKGKSFSLSSSSDTFNMDIKAAGYVAVNVVPDKWFSQNVVENRRNGPFLDTSIARDFFGKNKKLSMLPNKLYLVYKPEIVLRVGSEDVEYFRTTPKVSIGPFSGIVKSIIELVSDDDEFDLEFEDEPKKQTKVYKVVVRDEREDPLIIAIDNKLF